VIVSFRWVSFRFAGYRFAGYRFAGYRFAGYRFVSPMIISLDRYLCMFRFLIYVPMLVAYGGVLVNHFFSRLRPGT